MWTAASRVKRDGKLATLRRMAVVSGRTTARGPAGAVMMSLLWLIDTVITLYVWCLIISAVLSWLIAFRVLNTHNRFVYLLGDFLYRITEPALRPIRRFLPSFGGIDISPMVLILLLFFARSLLFEYWPV